MRRNGSVSITRYYSGDYSVVPPTDDTKTMKRYRGMKTDTVMEYLGDYFSEGHIGELICDGGVWGVEIENEDGQKYRYSGSLGYEVVFNEITMSEMIRQILNLNDLWLFDGGQEIE